MVQRATRPNFFIGQFNFSINQGATSQNLKLSARKHEITVV